MQHRLRRRHRHDQVGLDQRRIDPERHGADPADVDEIVGLGVVHDHAAAETPPELGRNEEPDVARRGSPQQPARDENRHVGDSEPVELVGDGSDRLVPRADLNTRDRQRRLLDDDRRRPADLRQLLERGSFQRIRERLADGRRDVSKRVPRRRRPQHQVVCRRLRDDDPRVGEQRDPAHVVRRAAAAETPSAMKIPPETYRRIRAAAPSRRNLARERIGGQGVRRVGAERDQDEQACRGSRSAAPPSRAPGRRTAAGRPGRRAPSSGSAR